MPHAFLFCADPLGPRRVDPHFAEAAAVVRDHGATVALIDHDALAAGDAEAAVRRVPRDLGPAWYRGWMVTAARYAELYEALAARGCALLTGPDAYAAAHELPGWYDAFRALTPASRVVPHRPGDPLPAGGLDAAAAGLGSAAAIVKDHVKSRKHEPEAFLVPDVGDSAGLHKVVATFLERQGEDLAGGIVLRAFEDFADGGGEARVWWLDGRAVAVTAHPDTPSLLPEPDLTGVGEAVRTLPARFVTTDLALRADGVWRVVEVGDGQVSDFPGGADFGPLAEVLTRVGR